MARYTYVMGVEHTAYADRVGAARLEDAKKNNREHVGHNIGDDKLLSYIRGIRCELAFYLWLGGKEYGVKWFSYKKNASAVELSEGADIVSNGICIDVKLRPVGWDDFAVRCQSLKDGFAYVLAIDDGYPEVEFFGFLWGMEVKRFRVGGRPEIPCHCIPCESELKDCRLLMTPKRLGDELNPPKRESSKTESNQGEEYKRGLMKISADLAKRDRDWYLSKLMWLDNQGEFVRGTKALKREG